MSHYCCPIPDPRMSVKKYLNCRLTEYLLIDMSEDTSVIPVDAAAAPIRIVGIPKRKKTKAAAKQVIFALAVEEADSVL